MASQLVVGVGYLAFLVILATVVGAVERRERYAFGAGVLLFLLGVSFLSGTAGAVVAVVGVVVVLAATVPLLRE